MEQGDEELLSLLATDLDHHFRRLVEIYQRRLYLFALRLTGHPADAEDIVQEVFLRAYHALKGNASLRYTWLRFQKSTALPSHSSILKLSVTLRSLNFSINRLAPSRGMSRVVNAYCKSSW
jgi:Sigma-70 region 2